MVQATKPVKTRRRRRILIAVVVGFALIWVGIITYRLLINAPATTDVETPVAAASVPIEPAPTALAIAAEGELRPRRSAELSFSLGRTVAEVLVSEGLSVTAGQPLVRLAAADLSAGAAQAKAGIEQAQAGLRAAELSLSMARARAEVSEAQIRAAQAGLSVSAAQVSSAEANLRAVTTEAPVVIAQAEATLTEAQARQLQAQASLEQAQAADTEAQAAVAQIEARVAEAQAAVAQAEAAYDVAEASAAKTLLSAPFDGTVARLDIEVGEAVSPGVEVVQLADFGGWLVETTDLTEIDVVHLDLGQEVDVTIDALPGETLTGTITRIASVSALKRGDVTYDVTVALNDTGGLPLRWGMTAFVDARAP